MRHLLELFLFFTILMGATDWYIYHNYNRYWQKVWVKTCYFIPTIILFVCMVIFFRNFEPNPDSMNRLGTFLVFFLCINIPKAIFSILTLLLKRLARQMNHSVYEIPIALSMAVLSLSYLIYGATEGKQHFQIIEQTIQSDELPQEFDGYRIVQIADIHAGSWGNDTEPLEKAVRMINSLKPDLIVFTGDLVNNQATELDHFIPVLSKLKAKHGIYSVLGNHDYSNYIQWKSKKEQMDNFVSLQNKQAEMGWKLLNNQHVKLYQGKDSIALIGVENSGRPPFPNHARLKEAMKGTEGMYQILLSHDPSHWRREVLPDTHIHLTLAGHTHAMQTRFLGLSPASLVYSEHCGLYQEGKQWLYVNIGLGHLLYPLRLGAWPEITLLTLKK